MMQNAFAQIMQERFGCDRLISLATCAENLPSVRTVNAYYLDGCFYVITYALSGKIQQIKQNPRVGVCGEWFSGHGVGENLGHVLKAEHKEIMQVLRAAFASWYGNGHVNERDENTCLLRIRLTDGVLFKDGQRYAFAMEDE